MGRKRTVKMGRGKKGFSPSTRVAGGKRYKWGRGKKKDSVV
jgi:hypothetical protein